MKYIKATQEFSTGTASGTLTLTVGEVSPFPLIDWHADEIIAARLAVEYTPPAGGKRKAADPAAEE